MIILILRIWTWQSISLILPIHPSTHLTSKRSSRRFDRCEIPYIATLTEWLRPSRGPTKCNIFAVNSFSFRDKYGKLNDNYPDPRLLSHRYSHQRHIHRRVDMHVQGRPLGSQPLLGPCLVRPSMRMLLLCWWFSAIILGRNVMHLLASHTTMFTIISIAQHSRVHCVLSGWAVPLSKDHLRGETTSFRDGRCVCW